MAGSTVKGSSEKKHRHARARGPGLFERIGLGRERGGGENETAQHIQEMKGLLALGLGLWLLVSLISFEHPVEAAEGGNWGGQAGNYVGIMGATLDETTTVDPTGRNRV